MADLIRNAMSWLGGKMKRFAAQSVVYSDGTNQVTVEASIGPSELLLGDGQVVQLSYQHRDFTITAADLVLNATQVVPARGHTITTTIQGVTHVYAVMLEGNGDVWTWSDSSQIRRKIHTKLVG
jgi:hypothetical protein